MFLDQPCVKFWYLQNDIHQHVDPQYPILHQSLRPYYWPNETCMITTRRKKWGTCWWPKLYNPLVFKTFDRDRSNFALNLTLKQ
jgi:hypothetical protein